MHPSAVEQLVHNKYAQASIRVKARQLCRRDDFSCSEIEDVEQDLWLHLLKQARNYNPGRSSLATFIDRMANVAAAILVRYRERGVRAHGYLADSLDDPSPGEFAHAPLSCSLSAADGMRRCSSLLKNHLSDLDDREAIQFALATMTPAVRAACQHIMAGTKPAQVARLLGTSRRQVRRLLATAAEHLTRAGFDEA